MCHKQRMERERMGGDAVPAAIPPWKRFALTIELLCCLMMERQAAADPHPLARQRVTATTIIPHPKSVAFGLGIHLRRLAEIDRRRAAHGIPSIDG